MSRLRFLLLLWVFFLPGIKVYGSSETSASVDRNGYEGLLMNNRMVCGVKGYFVDKEAIESFFDRCR